MSLAVRTWLVRSFRLRVKVEKYSPGFTTLEDSCMDLHIRGGHPIFFSWFAIDGSITFFLLFDFDKSRFLGI